MSLSSQFDPSSRLERLFGIGAGDFIGWGDEQLSDILIEQLRVPLAKWLRPNRHLIRSLSADACAPGSLRIASVGDLFQHPRPPLAYLKRAKEVAKSADNDLKPTLPPAVASALYFSIIAAAIVKCGQRITAMDDEQLCEGLHWVVDQNWIEKSLRQLATTAMETLS